MSLRKKTYEVTMSAWPGDGNMTSENQGEPPAYSSVQETTPSTQVSQADSSPHQPGRQQWSNKAEFILACVGNAVGLGNLWRFPYLCYSSGGGAFLIPYFIMLIFVGIPLLYLEYGMGQMTSLGPVGALQAICPFLQGAGAATVVLSFLFVTYYNVIMTWAFYYLFSTFQARLPWLHCNNTWNTPNCWSGNMNMTKPNDSVTSTTEFFERRVLQQSSGIHDMGPIRWDLLLILLLTWILVYICLWKGIRWTGKVVYVTATFPYLVIIILLVRGLTLPGAIDGVRFFIQPRWHLLAEPTVWTNAAIQNFNSIGISFGSMITFASYNRKNNRIFKDVLPVTLINSGTSILAGFAVFSILGHLAYVQREKVEDVVTQGPGLVFQVYPAAFGTMPLPQLFAALFFVMLIMLAVDSQFASVEVVVTAIEDNFGKYFGKILSRREVLVLIVCVVCFLLGFPCITHGGIYYFQIIDKYSSGMSALIIGFFEVVAVAWFYGARQFAEDLQYMTGRRPYLFFLCCWYVLAPLMILGLCIFSWVRYTPTTYGKYVFPVWAEGIGWGLAGLSLVCLPLGMIKGVVESQGSSLGKKLLNSFVSPMKRPSDTEMTGMDGKFTGTQKDSQM